MRPIHKCQSIDEMYSSCEKTGLAPIDTDIGKELLKVLRSVYDWRGLFDSGDHCWKLTTIEEKMNAINEIRKILRCKFDKLIWLYFKEKISHPNDTYQIAYLYSAICEYAAIDREAELFLMNCKHPYLLWNKCRLFDGLHKLMAKYPFLEPENAICSDPDLLLVLK